MSLNNVRLTPGLLADLYGNVLVETTATAAPEAVLKTLGGNAKNILIVVKREDQIILPQPELSFLTSILTACKLGLEDVAILNWNHAGDNGHKDVLHRFESRFVLLFDVTPLQFGLPMDFPPFQVQPFDNRQYLFAPALQKIQEHKGIKTELWSALKKMFLL